MTLDKLVAVGTFNKTRRADLPIRRAGISPRFRNLTLGHCHIKHLLFRAIKYTNDYLL